jgi:hypothetical protein
LLHKGRDSKPPAADIELQALTRQGEMAREFRVGE